MKKKLLGLALLGAMMATLLVGCGSSGGKKGDTKDDVITIGFLRLVQNLIGEQLIQNQ